MPLCAGFDIGIKNLAFCIIDTKEWRNFKAGDSTNPGIKLWKNINLVGDPETCEGEGKVVAYLARHGGYDFVCRWAGSNNAGHTVYVNGERYKTNLIPSGVFYGIISVIGPGCIVNKNAFMEEMQYLTDAGFNAEDLVKISPKAHLITEQHIQIDKERYQKSQGSTAKGIAPCYGDKYARIGKRVSEEPYLQKYLWDEKLTGKVLCEGAQGVWLDIDHGNYPYVTSSHTLPYAACSLGFPPQKIRRIYGAAKIYDTRVGIDPDFPDSLLDNQDLNKVAEIGKEFGTTTGRARKVNWLNVDKLIAATNMAGTTVLVISKVDVLEQIGVYKLIYKNKIEQYSDSYNFKCDIVRLLRLDCPYLLRIIFSGDPENVPDLFNKHADDEPHHA